MLVSWIGSPLFDNPNVNLEGFFSSPLCGAAAKPLQVVHTVKEYREIRNSLKGTVGFVPTMGNLHKGHLHLVKMARERCDTVVSSIFVNPAQFAPHEDIDKYPRTLETDLAMLKSEGCDYVFVPNAREMYPSGIVLDVKEQVGTFVEVKGRSEQMEGWVRPHFFRGVATVVLKLFNIAAPTHAFFGQKDAQQCVVVQAMSRDLFLPLEVVIGPTMREKDGLAMSSRNGYLSPTDREAGLAIFKALSAAEVRFSAGHYGRKELLEVATQAVASEPRVKLEYFSLAHPLTLAELDEVGDDGAILSGAIKTSSTRLIDNFILRKGQKNDLLFVK